MRLPPQSDRGHVIDRSPWSADRSTLEGRIESKTAHAVTLRAWQTTSSVFMFAVKTEFLIVWEHERCRMLNPNTHNFPGQLHIQREMDIVDVQKLPCARQTRFLKRGCCFEAV